MIVLNRIATFRCTFVDALIAALKFCNPCSSAAGTFVRHHFRTFWRCMIDDGSIFMIIPIQRHQPGT